MRRGLGTPGTAEGLSSERSLQQPVAAGKRRPAGQRATGSAGEVALNAGGALVLIIMRINVSALRGWRERQPPDLNPVLEVADKPGPPPIAVGLAGVGGAAPRWNGQVAALSAQRSVPRISHTQPRGLCFPSLSFGVLGTPGPHLLRKCRAAERPRWPAHWPSPNSEKRSSWTGFREAS